MPREPPLLPFIGIVGQLVISSGFGVFHKIGKTNLPQLDARGLNEMMLYVKYI